MGAPDKATSYWNFTEPELANHLCKMLTLASLPSGLGNNTMAQELFLTEVSLNCGLSKINTNHYIRVTGATVFTRMSFTLSETMSITGHECLESHKITVCTG